MYLKDELIKVVEKTFPESLAIMVSGSYLNNSYSDYSDIDVIVITNKVSRITNLRDGQYDFFLLPVLKLTSVIIEDIYMNGKLCSLLESGEIIDDKDNILLNLKKNLILLKKVFFPKQSRREGEKIRKNISLFLEDIKSSVNDKETMMLVLGFVEYFGSAVLRNMKVIPGSGKHMIRKLETHSPSVYKDLFRNTDLLLKEKIGNGLYADRMEKLFEKQAFFYSTEIRDECSLSVDSNLLSNDGNFFLYLKRFKNKLQHKGCDLNYYYSMHGRTHFLIRYKANRISIIKPLFLISFKIPPYYDPNKLVFYKGNKSATAYSGVFGDEFKVLLSDISNELLSSAIMPYEVRMKYCYEILKTSLQKLSNSIKIKFIDVAYDFWVIGYNAIDWTMSINDFVDQYELLKNAVYNDYLKFDSNFLNDDYFQIESHIIDLITGFFSNSYNNDLNQSTNKIEIEYLLTLDLKRTEARSLDNLLTYLEVIYSIFGIHKEKVHILNLYKKEYGF